MVEGKSPLEHRLGDGNPKNCALSPLIIVPEELADLIEIPENPYIHFGKELTKDEMIAMAIGGAATYGADLLLNALFSGECPRAIRAPVLGFVQPIAEKPALTYRHIRKAYKDNPKKGKRRTLQGHKEIIIEGLRDSAPIMRADILYHDPYQWMIMTGLTAGINPDSSLEVVLLQGASFLIALAGAAATEVKSVDLRYKYLTRKLVESGFGSLSYFESRYLVTPESRDHSPRQVIERIIEEFELPEKISWSYHDNYMRRLKIDKFNAWKPYVRFRERNEEDGDRIMRSTQVNFTNAFQVKRKKRSLYNCYACAKRKFFLPIQGEEMVWDSEGIEDPKVRKRIQKIERETEYHRVRFWREGSRDPEGLFVTVDVPYSLGDGKPDLENFRGRYWIEVKVHEDLGLLLDANDYIAKHFPVDSTTKNKLELTAS